MKMSRDERFSCFRLAVNSCGQHTEVRACVAQLGGSGVMVQPMTYIFDEEPSRWRTIVEEVGLPESVTASIG